MANALSGRENADVLLILPDGIAPEHREAIDGKVKTFFLKHADHPYLFAPSIINQIVKQVRSFGPDVIHVQVSRLLLLPLLPLLKRYPIVTTFHDVKPHTGEDMPLLETLHRSCIKRSGAVVVHGKKLKQEMRKYYGINEEKVLSIPLPEHEVFPFLKYKGKESKGFDMISPGTILFFGRIKKYKGLEYLIEAEPVITGEVPDARIVIAGTGDNMEGYRNMMDNSDSFTILDRFISYEEGAALFGGCSMVVLPYTEASQSGVIHPAYAFGKPVVATDVGSIPEILDDGVTGIIVPPGDSEALAKAVVKLLKDDELRKEMGGKGREKLKTDLSWDGVTADLMDVYAKLVRMNGEE
jgi:glycosyltransferase involved in cell wall biosynthesis